MVPEAPCDMRDLPQGPPHVNVPSCVYEPLPDADGGDPDAPRLVLGMIMAHQSQWVSGRGWRDGTGHVDLLPMLSGFLRLVVWPSPVDKIRVDPLW